MSAIALDYLPRLPSDAGQKVGIGCIGAGFIMADCHLVAYRQAGFNPVAISSRDPERAKAVAKRHDIAKTYASYSELLDDPQVEVVDIAVPPDIQREVVREVVKHKQIRGVLAQKPLGVNYAQAKEIVALCRDAGITLAVNQNMRFDQSIRGCKSLLERDVLGEPVLATIDMRAIPHWMPWQQRQGWVTLRIMSIHHLDTFRYLFGDPERIYASVRPDPRTTFPHEDGICLYILEYANGFRAASWDDVWAGPAKEGAAADIGIRWRVEGTIGMAHGTIGWPSYPERTPSTLDYTTSHGPDAGRWISPRWDEVWFPDAFVGPMAELLLALEEHREPSIGGEDNLKTMALVDAAYLSAAEHRAVTLDEILDDA
ncbi:MAG: Gfo/Idh/MocA family oxidoreductase [Planctomycetota bacterium]|nr:Gfo/Idh/MocA family oxidoreductase [Planctomycetaceae bacterium]MDQ3331156.1 Gfo/Idh/MocA family oxidoreductase [Planctomycetota bacterium]